MPGKILVIHSSNEMFGSDQVLLRTVLALKTAGWSPLVLLPNDLAYTGELSRELERNRIPVRVMSLGILRRRYLLPHRAPGYLFTLLRAVLKVRRLIRAEQIRVVYSATGAVLCGAGAAALTRTDHVWHIHEILQRPFWMVKILSGIYVGFSRRLIAVSQAVCDHWVRINHGLREKMTVIHNGVDLDYYFPGAGRNAVRRKLGLEPDDVVVGCLGRIGTWKGQEVLLEALHLLGNGGQKVKGLIAGGTLPGKEFMLQVLWDRVGALGLEGRVVLQQFQKDVRPILEALDAVAVPSVKPEPFGMVILEAMAFGLPVIATNIGGSPEVVEDGSTGFLVPANDARALAGAISDLATCPQKRKQFGRAGRRRVAEHFSLPTYRKKVTAFFADLEK